MSTTWKSTRVGFYERDSAAIETIRKYLASQRPVGSPDVSNSDVVRHAIHHRAAELGAPVAAVTAPKRRTKETRT